MDYTHLQYQEKKFLFLYLPAFIGYSTYRIMSKIRSERRHRSGNGLPESLRFNKTELIVIVVLALRFVGEVSIRHED